MYPLEKKFYPIPYSSANFGFLMEVCNTLGDHFS
jgi:hypothetical protein